MPGSPLQSAACPTPVLLLVFNRPELTCRVLAALRQVRPARVYVAADGPRTHVPTDAALCQQVRELVEQGIDWPCQVFTLFRATNLNCGVGPASAIDWFFRQEEEGIILEDDCVPAPSFFRFCEEMLARYRHDTRVMHIGGNNFSREARQPQPADAESYYFSTQVNSWGWATWRRAWQYYDFELTQFRMLRRQGKLHGLFGSALESRYRLGKIVSVLDQPQPPDVWDYQWHFAIAANSGLCIVPATNLVGNIGFGAQGTHTLHSTDEFANVPTIDLRFPLRHPPTVLADRRRDDRRFREFLQGRVISKLRRFIARRPVPLLPHPPPAYAPPLPVVPSTLHA